MPASRTTRASWVHRTLAVGALASVVVLGGTQMSASAAPAQSDAPSQVDGTIPVSMPSSPDTSVTPSEVDEVEAESSSQTTIKTQAEIDAEADIVVKRAKNCDDPILGGARNIKDTDPLYEAHLDGDKDGTACDAPVKTPAPSGPSSPNTPLAPSFTG